MGPDGHHRHDDVGNWGLDWTVQRHTFQYFSIRSTYRGHVPFNQPEIRIRRFRQLVDAFDHKYS
jgi:hypothetical protein